MSFTSEYPQYLKTRKKLTAVLCTLHPFTKLDCSRVLLLQNPRSASTSQTTRKAYAISSRISLQRGQNLDKVQEQVDYVQVQANSGHDELIRGELMYELRCIEENIARHNQHSGHGYKEVQPVDKDKQLQYANHEQAN
mmetsp:Transcript_21384/g.31097  ORF Transcript_21384/g.31097 Transcript_21384/m.31097 type:complete len:138 (+) Transcript_21384:1353-1766(+)